MNENDTAEGTDVDQLLHSGKSLRSQGRKQDAVGQLSRAFALAPTREDVYVELILAFLDTQQFGKVIDVCEHVLKMASNHSKAHFYQGVALHFRSQTVQAAGCFEKAIECDPCFIDAYVNLGNMLHATQEFDRAIGCYQRAIELGDTRAIVLFNLAGSQHKLGLNKEAIHSLTRAIGIDPNYAKAYKRLGDIYADQGDTELAINAYTSASTIDHQGTSALVALGSLLRRHKRLDEAATWFMRAASREPFSSDALTGLGNVRFDEGMFDEAFELQRRALQCSPDNTTILCNYGQVLQALGRLDESLAVYNRAIQLDPHLPRAHFNRSLILLLMGKFEEGFEEYEWRWLEVSSKRPLGGLEWNGDDLHGKSILLYAEQGLGDTIQFIRFIDQVRTFEPQRIYLECQAALYPLLQSSLDVEWIPRGKELPAADFHLPLMSLPRVLRVHPSNYASRIPYLTAENRLVEFWKDRLQKIIGYKVGIVWQGSEHYPKDRLRSIPLQMFSALAQVPSVRLISLQKGYGTEQIHRVDFEVISFEDELDRDHGPFVDTAALIKNLDLVVTIDSAVVHLAGALNATTWLPTNSQPDWRWMQSGSSSPWYPSVKLFRQKKRNDWESVFQQLRLELLAMDLDNV